MNSLEGRVIRGHTAVVQRKRVHTCLRHILLGEHAGKFPCPVVAEVEENHCVTLGNLAHSLPVGTRDYCRLDELVGNTFSIRCFNGFCCGSGLDAFAADEHIVGLFHTVPSLVAVHSIEPSADRCNLSAAARHLLFKFLHEAFAALRVAIASVHKAVNENLLKTVFLGNREELVNVCKGRVHSAHGSQAHKMESLAVGLCIIVGCLDFGILKQFVVAAGDVDFHKVLIHDPSCTEVEVAHFRIAHLSVRQSHIFAAGLKVAERIFLAERIDVWSALGVDCIGPIVLSLAPSVKNHQKYFSFHNIYVIIIS